MRAKTFVPVGVEPAKGAGSKDHMQANLLANMELGGNSQPSYPIRVTGEEVIQMQPLGKSDDPPFQMRGTDESDDAYYSRGPLQVCHSWITCVSQAELCAAAGRELTDGMFDTPILRAGFRFWGSKGSHRNPVSIVCV